MLGFLFLPVESKIQASGEEKCHINRRAHEGRVEVCMFISRVFISQNICFTKVQYKNIKNNEFVSIFNSFVEKTDKLLTIFGEWMLERKYNKQWNYTHTHNYTVNVGVHLIVWYTHMCMCICPCLLWRFHFYSTHISNGRLVMVVLCLSAKFSF